MVAALCVKHVGIWYVLIIWEKNVVFVWQDLTGVAKLDMPTIALQPIYTTCILQRDMWVISLMHLSPST